MGLQKNDLQFLADNIVEIDLPTQKWVMIKT